MKQLYYWKSFAKVFLDLDIMSELNDYILAADILMRLPNKTSEKLKRELMLNLKSKLLCNMEDWRKIMGFLVYIMETISGKSAFNQSKV